MNNNIEYDVEYVLALAKITDLKNNIRIWMKSKLSLDETPSITISRHISNEEEELEFPGYTSVYNIDATTKIYYIKENNSLHLDDLSIGANLLIYDISGILIHSQIINTSIIQLPRLRKSNYILRILKESSDYKIKIHN